jgi:hypothetical protein
MLSGIIQIKIRILIK